MEEKLLEKCLEWLDHSVEKDNISVVAGEDDGTYHRRVYLAVWNDNQGLTHAYLIRVWTNNEGRDIDLSQDYGSYVRIEDFVNTIPSIVEVVNRVR